jgi:NAD(P)-dependent dehydrogenase (short-subunit alcohol dehydrogenase family)
MLSGTTKGQVMGKLEGKVAVITGGSSGMALASAQRFVEEGAYVFITGRKQEGLDQAVKLIGRNVTGVRGDAANLDDLDRMRAPASAKPSSWARSPRSISMPPSG